MCVWCLPLSLSWFSALCSHISCMKSCVQSISSQLWLTACWLVKVTSRTHARTVYACIYILLTLSLPLCSNCTSLYCDMAKQNTRFTTNSLYLVTEKRNYANLSWGKTPLRCDVGKSMYAPVTLKVVGLNVVNVSFLPLFRMCDVILQHMMSKKA